MAELAFAAGLLLVLAFYARCTANGLAVRDTGRGQHNIHAKLLGDTADDDVKMQVPHPRNYRLSSF